MNALKKGDRVTFGPSRYAGEISFPIKFAATVSKDEYFIPGSSLGPFVEIIPDDPSYKGGMPRNGARFFQARGFIRISDLRKMINENLDEIEAAPKPSSEWTEAEKEQGESDREIDRKIDERRGK